ncbi:MAG: ribosome biogenesis GTPase Der [bacterium]|nr:ribosome biogenesis GTPase Der [bacterium]
MPVRTIQKENPYPLVALVGRVNVGKSTLFNRLIEEKKAVISSDAGTTRDVNYGIGNWRDFTFQVADSGGFVPKPTDEIEEKTYAHALAMLKKADVILFIVDGKEDIHPDDRAYLKVIQKATKTPVYLVINKIDKQKEHIALSSQNWNKLGIGSGYSVSAASGRGVGDLLDEVHPLLKRVATPAPTKAPIKVAIVGRTNVGKSSLLNAILDEERVIASPIAHTTREPHDTIIVYEDQPIILIDTVGIRKQSKVQHGIEYEGVKRSIKNIEKADVALLVLDAMTTASKQESRLADIAVSSGAGIVLVVNKWDLVEEKTVKSSDAYKKYFHKFFEFIKWAPDIFVSALTKQRVKKILDIIIEVQKEREKEIPQEELTAFLKTAMTRQPPIWPMGRKRPRIFGIKQRLGCPPTFILSVNSRASIRYEYLRYLENRLRELYSFQGTPVMVVTEEKSKKKSA